MKKIIFLLAAYTASGFLSYKVQAHAEHDKPRYVSTTGVDAGECEDIDTPCLTIGYAARMSNKGDIVKVEEGTYHFKDVSNIFYLTNDLVKIRGGYGKGGQYKKPNPKAFPTYITGIPSEFHNELKDKGFSPLQDSKAMSKADRKILNQKLAAVKSLSEAQSNVPCVDGKAGEFVCQNLDLVAHLPLPDMSSNPNSANDIWGHVDLNTGIEYALLGVNTGVHVFDISNPAEPKEVGHIEGQNTNWRDIKVYQYFSRETKSWQAYAYSSADGAFEGITIIDLTHLPEVKLVDRDLDNRSQHNIYISNVDYSTGVPINDYEARLHVLGANEYGGSQRSYHLTNPEKLEAAYTGFENTVKDYSHDGTSMMVEDSRAETQCNETGGFCDVFIDFNENEVRLWNQTVPENTTELGNVTYNDVQYVHSGWWSEDKKTIFVHDELDEVRNGHNTHLYIFDVSDLTAPKQLAVWEGPSPAIDHNGYVRGNRYYMSNYERGLTVLDITDPTTASIVGHFDTFPTSDGQRFNGNWGVYPFLPSGLILVSDINSGLYILKDNTLDSVHGTVEFAETKLNINEGEPARFVVNRVGGVDGERGAITVDYETIHQSANEEDYTPAKGTLEWAAGDMSPREIMINSTLDTDETEVSEQFGIRLFNVTGGATIGANRGASAVMPGGPNYGLLRFVERGITVYEGVDFTDGKLVLDIELARRYGSDGSLEASVVVDESSDPEVTDDVTLQSNRFSWADGELSTQSFKLEIIDDDLSENVETLVLSLADFVPAEATQDATLEVRIVDDESNEAPTVSLNAFTVDQGYVLALRSFATVNDDTEELFYQWSIDNQGKNTTIEGADTLDATLYGYASGDFKLTLTVTDIFGKSATASSTITIRESATSIDDMPTPEPPKKESSGSSSPLLLLCGLTLLAIRRLKID